MSLIVTIIVVIYLVLFFAFGFHKGFFRMILTTMSLVVTLVVSAFLVTPVTNWVIENTEIQASVEKSVSKALGLDIDSDSSSSVSGWSSVEDTTSESSESDDTASESSSSNKKSFWEQIKEAADELTGELGLSGSSETKESQDSDSQIQDAPETVSGWEENTTSLNKEGISAEASETVSNDSESVENETVLAKTSVGEDETTVDYSQYEEYIEQYGGDISDYTDGDISSWEDVENELGGNQELLTEVENDAIDSLSIPTFLKNMLTQNNNAEEYVKLGVSNFKEYIVRTISNLIIKILVYIALVIAILIIIRILLMLTKVISRIPIIHGFNKFFGGILGLLQGLLYLWLACLLISVFAQTSFGLGLMDVINGSFILQWIYENNLISILAKSIVSVF